MTERVSSEPREGPNVALAAFYKFEHGQTVLCFIKPFFVYFPLIKYLIYLKILLLFPFQQQFMVFGSQV